GRDRVLVEVPVVDVDLYAAVVQEAEALERVQVWAAGGRDRRLDLHLGVVIGDVELLRDRVDRIGKGDRLPVVPLRAEVLGVVEGDLADGLRARGHRRPLVVRRVPGDRIGRDVHLAARPGRVDLVVGRERLR